MVGCCPVVVAQWKSTGCTSQVSWVRFPATASLSLSQFRLKTSKFSLFITFRPYTFILQHFEHTQVIFRGYLKKITGQLMACSREKRYLALPTITILVCGSLGNEAELRIKVCLSACMLRIAVHSSGAAVKPRCFG